MIKNPPNKRRSKYYIPHTETSDRLCDHAGCNKAGLYKAPKDRGLKDYYWFCLEHVTEYNANWNYFSEMDEEDIEEQIQKDTVWGRSSWKYGTSAHYFNKSFTPNSDFLGTGSKGDINIEISRINSKERAILILELQVPFTKAELKHKYKVLAKKYHPDINAGDKKAEERFKEISWAYNELLLLAV